MSLRQGRLARTNSSKLLNGKVVDMLVVVCVYERVDNNLYENRLGRIIVR